MTLQLASRTFLCFIIDENREIISLTWLTFRRIFTVNGISRSLERHLEAVLRRVVLIIFGSSIQYLIQSCVEDFSSWWAHGMYCFHFGRIAVGGQCLCPCGSFPPHRCVAASETGPFTCEGWTLSLETVIRWNYIFEVWGPCIYYWWGWRSPLIDDAWSYCTCWWMEVTIDIYLWCQSIMSADLSTSWWWKEVWVSPRI